MSMFIKEVIKAPSPSRTYVAVCNNSNFEGHYFKKFVLPEIEENTLVHACWYFLNKVDFTACIDMIITWEDYTNLTDSNS